MMGRWSVASLLVLCGCGRFSFDELPFTSKLTTGVYTVDAELCVDEPSELRYALSTKPWLEGWEKEPFVELTQQDGVFAQGAVSRVDDCTTYTVPVLQGGSIYLYALASNADSDETFAEARVATTQPVFQARALQAAAGYPAWYWVHYPEAYFRHPEKPYPTLLYLHSWESNGYNDGVNLEQVLSEELPQRYLRGLDSMTELPFLVVAPQCNQQREGCFGWSGPRLMEFLDDTLADLRRVAAIDERRFYVTGISSGGEGAWRYAMHRPGLVDAIVPIAATLELQVPRPGHYDESICRMKDVPVWAFHNTLDLWQPPSNAQTLVDKLLACEPPVAPRLDLGSWQIAPGGHGGWAQVYGDTHGFENTGMKTIYEWLLSH